LITRASLKQLPERAASWQLCARCALNARCSCGNSPRVAATLAIDAAHLVGRFLAPRDAPADGSVACLPPIVVTTIASSRVPAGSVTKSLKR
jgi:hypothetical protein